jgi:hypothetical protein
MLDRDLVRPLATPTGLFCLRLQESGGPGSWRLWHPPEAEQERKSLKRHNFYHTASLAMVWYEGVLQFSLS